MQADIVVLLTIFVLAIFIGFEVITKVPPTLHTPLMSGANAISGIAIVGAIVVAGRPRDGQCRRRLRRLASHVGDVQEEELTPWTN